MNSSDRYYLLNLASYLKSGGKISDNQAKKLSQIFKKTEPEDIKQKINSLTSKRDSYSKEKFFKLMTINITKDSIAQDQHDDNQIKSKLVKNKTAFQTITQSVKENLVVDPKNIKAFLGNDKTAISIFQEKLKSIQQDFLKIKEASEKDIQRYEKENSTLQKEIDKKQY